MASLAVEDYQRALDPATNAMIAALRRIITDAQPGLSESIKWNAPSFALDGEDRITLGIERKGGVRVVLHRGAKQKIASGFSFADDAKLAKWPSADRGVVTFGNVGEVEARRDALSDIVRRWIDATS